MKTKIKYIKKVSIHSDGYYSYMVCGICGAQMEFDSKVNPKIKVKNGIVIGIDKRYNTYTLVCPNGHRITEKQL